MPITTTPPIDSTTGIMTNVDAEIVDALIVEDFEAEVTPEVPATPRPDCLLCGQDYVIRPDAGLGDADPTTMLIAGCECDGCVALAAMAAETAAATDEAPVDPTPFMTPLSLTVSPSRAVPATTHTGDLCPDCATAANAWNPRSCAYCSEYLGPDSTIAETLGTGDFGDRLSRLHAGTVAGMTVGVAPVRVRAGSRASRGRTWYLRSAVVTDELSEDAHMQVVCENCYDAAASCDCGVLVVGGAEYYCDDCDTAAMCHGCFIADHQHREANTLEEARTSFRPRSSIEGALGFTGVPGETIISTRALGIEVETARGDAAAVVRAEAAAPVPVIAQLGSDGSVRGRGAVEFRLLPQRGMWAEYAIRSMAEWCREAGYRPDSTAGIHMHVDASDLIHAEVYQALAVLVSLDDVLFAHATSDRRNSTYCVPFRREDRPGIIAQALSYARSGSRFTYAVTGDSRYRSVNTHAYAGHGTLEVRVFDSCHETDAVERFTDAAAIIAGAVDFARLDAFRDLLDVWPSLADADVTLARMAEAGCITHSCALRAIARLRESTPASVAA